MLMGIIHYMIKRLLSKLVCFPLLTRIPLIPRNPTTGDVSPTRNDRKRATPKKDKNSEEKLMMDGSPVPMPTDIEEKVCIFVKQILFVWVLFALFMFEERESRREAEK